MSEARARRIVIRGRVQGVWFRDWTVKSATELGLAGWVRNRRDGSVEVHVEGEEQAIARYVELAHDGPPAADVLSVEIGEAACEGATNFSKRATD